MSGQSRGAWARVRRAAAELTPEAIEQIAQRVVGLLEERREHQGSRREPGSLLTAAQLARHLGVTRAWVYEHANELGGIRLGSSAKPRIRFDLATATTAFPTRQIDDGVPPKPASARRPGGRLPERREPVPTVPLLPINPPRSRGLVHRFVLSQRKRDW